MDADFLARIRGLVGLALGTSIGIADLELERPRERNDYAKAKGG
ncbi:MULTISPECIES: hypothetical protein [unclassified Mesorhizobium]|nr:MULTISPECIES: hypothetical protein [unclassified Mesorhizobium]